MVTLLASLTDEEVAAFDSLEAVRDGEEWGVDATPFVEWVKDASGVDLLTLSVLDPAALSVLSLYLSIALIVQAPHLLTAYAPIGRLLQFASFIRTVSDTGSSLKITHR